jgi:sirohydrochlorin cobaltochelatase
MIGRGGSDLEALDEMRRFVDLRMQLTPAADVTIGFMAGNGPTLAEALDAAERSGIRRIVVQPHLLFQGRLVREVGRQTLERAVRRPDLEWFMADHLGPADEVISILVENYAG